MLKGISIAREVSALSMPAAKAALAGPSAMVRLALVIQGTGDSFSPSLHSFPPCTEQVTTTWCRGKQHARASTSLASYLPWRGESSIPNLCTSNAGFRRVKLSGDLRLVPRPAHPSRQDTDLGPYCTDPRGAGAILDVNVEAEELTGISKNSENHFQHHSL